MPQATQKFSEGQERDLKASLKARLVEATALLLGTIGACLIIALSTFDTRDPAWSHIAKADHINNSMGVVGAWIADVFYYLLGLIAYLIPAVILLLAISLVRKLRPPPATAGLWWLRVNGCILSIVTACGLAYLHGGSIGAELPVGAGGILGQILGIALSNAFNPLGASLILLTGFLTGVTLFSGLSWIKLSERIGRLTVLLATRLRQRLVDIRWPQIQWRVLLALGKQHLRLPARVRTAAPELIRDDEEDDIELGDVSLPMVREADEPKKKPQLIAKEQQMRLFMPAKKKKSKNPKRVKTRPGFPGLDLLERGDDHSELGFSKERLQALSDLVEATLADFSLEVKVESVHPGPVVTRFELQLAPGVKVSKLTGLAKDIARSLSVISVRVVEVIPGKSTVGLEIPNEQREMVRLRCLIESENYQKTDSPLTIALGKDISGKPVTANLAKMPHLLVAGTTGSGKSVGVNAMLVSILYKATPDDVRLIMIDPKMLELSIYEGIPHLLTPVVTDMKDAANALRWCVGEMERRYKLLAAMGVRSLDSFNRKVKEAIKNGEPIIDPTWKPITGEPAPTLEPLPYIVVVVDEFADMMMVVGKKVEELIARIAQKARAAGIHMILATQRPSVDVITGLIKANVPTRIAFQVSSRIDSRTILDQQGAEQLLGHGDMLYLPPGSGIPKRVHGAFVADQEVHNVVQDWKSRGEPEYIQSLVEENFAALSSDGENFEDRDDLYDQAVFIVTESRRASISHLQRRLKIGYNRAARLIETMEQEGIVSAVQSGGNREVIAPPPVEA